MSRRYNRHDRNKIGWIIFIIFILTSIGGIGKAVIGLGAFLVVIAIAIALIAKVLNSSGGYTEVKKDNRPNQNPYSAKMNKDDKSVSLNVDIDTNRAEGDKIRIQSSNTQTEAPKAQAAPAPAKPARQSTGDKDIDKMIEDKDAAIAEMHRLNASIKDPTLSDQIEHLEAVTDKIVSYVVAHPKKKKQVTKFFSYYLPTTLKLLNAYDRMDEAGISGTNIDGTKGKVEEMMGTALNAFDKQLDALFAEEALDVTTDISVMENMLKAEGLMDDELMNEAKELVKSYQE
ncbi:MAG: 5-bromo-4-chloroindolyl phosphate hydrolysis family protein [Lachnospiraceae bacterium]|nr:5-bromo-4-chloroindolyl phosphate hydrolysis family protein [Lachnospiraceae bacterium]